MTREECEKAIVKKLEEISRIILEYNPDTNYLAACIQRKKGNWAIDFSNEYWEDGNDHDKPLNYYHNGE